MKKAFLKHKSERKRILVYYDGVIFNITINDCRRLGMKPKAASIVEFRKMMRA